MCGDILKFRLVEEFNILNENVLNEGYEILWKQFEDLADIRCKEYELHHIYNDTCSTNNGDINFVLLPRDIHSHMPKNKYRQDAIEVYEYLKERYPESFKSINVSFEVFTPDSTEGISSKQKRINNLRRNSRRNKYKKPSTAEIIRKVDKERTTV